MAGRALGGGSSHGGVRGRYDRITDADVANLVFESAAAPVQIALVGVLEAAPRTAAGGLDLGRVRSEVAERVAGVPRLRQVLLFPPSGGGQPVWVDGAEFRPDRHVLARALDPPGDEAAFRRACAELVATPLPRDRPLWRLDLLTGAADGTVGLVLRLHHVLADGVTAVRLATALLGPDRPAETGCSAPAPSAAALVADGIRVRAATAARAVRHPGRLVRVVRTLGRTLREGAVVARSSSPGPPASLNVPVGIGRRVAFLELPLAGLREAAHRSGGTVNDAVLAMVAGGVRALLLHRGEPVDLPVRASVPVSLHTGGADAANAVTIAVVPLPLGPSCVDRLAAVARRTAELTRAARRTGPPGMFRSRLAMRVALPFFRRQRLVQLFVTSVRGRSVWPAPCCAGHTRWARSTGTSRSGSPCCPTPALSASAWWRTRPPCRTWTCSSRNARSRGRAAARRPRTPLRHPRTGPRSRAGPPWSVAVMTTTGQGTCGQGTCRMPQRQDAFPAAMSSIRHLSSAANGPSPRQSSLNRRAVAGSVHSVRASLVSSVRPVPYERADRLQATLA